MRSTELLAFGVEGTLSDRLAAWALDRGQWFRPVQHASALLNLLSKGSQGVVLIRLGRDIVGEMELLQTAAHDFSGVTIIVLGDLDHPLLEGLAYDLGAGAVLFPPRGVDEMFEMLSLWQAALK
jgi:hypothetical protein